MHGIRARGDGFEHAVDDAAGGVRAVRVALLGLQVRDVERDDAGCAVEHLLEGFRRIREQERIGVLALGERRDARRDALGEQDAGGADRGLAPGVVAVEQENGAVRVAVQQRRVLGRESRALGRHRARKAAGVAADDVDLPLAENRLAVLRRRDRALRLVERVEHAGLLEDVRFGAVDVLGAAFRRIEDARAERHDASAVVADREHEAPVEAVAQGRARRSRRDALRQRAEAGRDHFGLREAVGAREGVERAGAVRVVAEAELLGRFAGKAAFFEVRAGDLRLRHPEQAPAEERGGLGVRQEEALRARGARVGGALDDFDAALFGEVLHRIEERHAVVLHQELEDVPVLAAAEAVEALAARAHVEARRLLVVERAARHEPAARPLERQAVADHLHDVGPFPDVFDCRVGNHVRRRGAADAR